MTPNGWQRYQIGGLLANDTPGYWGAPPSGSGDIAVLRSTNLRDNEKLDFGNIATRSFSEKKIIQKRLEPGDVLLERSGGGPNKPVGRVAYFQANGTYSCSNFMQRLRPNLERVGGKFLAYELSYLHASSVTFRMQQATTGIRNLNYAEYLAYQLAVPPLSEQRKIAVILSSVDDAIEKTQAVIDQTQVVKRGVMDELFTWGLPGWHTRFKQTEIGEIPEEWAIVRIIDVADVDYGISAAVSTNTDPSIGWPILTGANLTLDGKIDLFKLVYHEPPSKERFHLRKSDLLLNWRSGSPKHVGKTALFDLEGNYTYASFVLRIRSRGKLVPGFGHVLLNFMRNAGFFSKDLSQQVNFKMNAAVFREILIRLPSVDEQEEIAQTAARFDSRLASEAQSLAALQNVKSALMSVLLTGELRVTPDPEPE